MDIIKKLKERYKGYKEKKFLEAHGCKTWNEYERRYDSDVGHIARWAHTFYHGYPYVFPLEPDGYKDLHYHGVYPYLDAVVQMTEWCQKNCKGKWRNDWHRGFWDTQGNFEFNAISGSDLMFFAFKEESDYVWFRLTWE